MKPSQRPKPAEYYRLRKPGMNIVPRIPRMMPAGARRYKAGNGTKKAGGVVGEPSGRWRFSRLRIITRPVAFWVRRSFKDINASNDIAYYEQVMQERYEGKRVQVVRVVPVGDPLDRIVQITGVVKVN